MINEEVERLTIKTLDKHLLATGRSTYRKVLCHHNIMDSWKIKENSISNYEDSALFSVEQLIRFYMPSNSVFLDSIQSTIIKILIKERTTFANDDTTVQAFVKNIIDKTFQYYGRKYISSYRQFRREGYSFCTIKQLIDDDKPVMLSMLNDGRDYYQYHSVIVYGYVEFLDKEENVIRLLKVHDGLNELDSSYIDFDEIDRVSFINFILS